MYRITMLSGDTPPTQAEAVLRQVAVVVITSRRCAIDARTWSLDLTSPFWRLYVHDHPGASVIVAGRAIPIRPGRPLLVPAWVGFRTAISGCLDQDYLHFLLTGLPASLHRRMFAYPIELDEGELPAAMLARWRAGLADPSPTAIDLDSFAWAAATASAGLACASARLDPDARAICQAWLHGSAKLRPALEAIEQRLGDPPSNAELAALCGCSVNQLIRRFNAALGMTPARYGQERRVAVAAGWLLEPERGLESIAEAAGFTDRYHFSRAFRSHFGTPPAAWRRQHAGGR